MTFRDMVRAAWKHGYRSAEQLPVELFATMAHAYCTEPEWAKEVNDRIISNLDPEVVVPGILARFYDEQSQSDLTPDERVMSHREAQRNVWHVMLDAANAGMREAIDAQFATHRMLSTWDEHEARREATVSDIEADDRIERARDMRREVA